MHWIPKRVKKIEHCMGCDSNMPMRHGIEKKSWPWGRALLPLEWNQWWPHRPSRRIDHWPHPLQVYYTTFPKWEARFQMHTRQTKCIRHQSCVQWDVHFPHLNTPSWGNVVDDDAYVSRDTMMACVTCDGVVHRAYPWKWTWSQKQRVCFPKLIVIISTRVVVDVPPAIGSVSIS